MNIVFAHNVYTRFQTLYENIQMEKKLFPTSQSIVGYNADNPADFLKEFSNVELIKFQGITHKIGCTNGCITTIQAAIKYEPDVIIFSHDDVRINPAYHNIVLSNIEKITSGKFDAICRKPLPVEVYGQEYYMMEVFFLSKRGAIDAFKNRSIFIDENLIPKDKRGSVSPEVFLYQALHDKKLKIEELGYTHTIDNYNNTLASQLGFVHKNAGQRGWND